MQKYVVTIKEGQELWSLGRNKLTEVATKAGAIRRIGRAVRIDVATMNAAIDALVDQKEVKTA